MDKTFTVGGTSVKNGVRTWRFANGTAEARANVLLKDNHTEVNLIALPSAMTRDAAIAFLKSKGFDAVDPPKAALGGAPREPKPTREPKVREERVREVAPEAPRIYIDPSMLDRDRDGQIIMPNRGRRGPVPNPHFFLVRAAPGVEEWIRAHHFVSKVEDGFVFVHDSEFGNGDTYARNKERLVTAMKGMGLREFYDMRGGKWKGPTLSDEVVWAEKVRLEAGYNRQVGA